MISFRTRLRARYGNLGLAIVHDLSAVEGYVNYEYEVEPWFKAMPRPMFEALERAMGWHLLIYAKPV